MNLPFIFKRCFAVVAFTGIATLVVVGFHELFSWLLHKLERTTRPELFWIGLIFIPSSCFLSMYLMRVLVIHFCESPHDLADNQDQRHGFNHAPSQDDLQHGIETLNRTRTLVKEPEEGRKQKLQDLFKLFPSVSYTSQGIGSEPGDCAICLGEFVEGELCWILPSCKHIFHFLCIDRWLMIGFCCPVCRNSVLPI
ncbi:MFS domain-containing protein [Psidium guajava]|nr:MFS domain-containing protein [Psidium guajava]